MRVLQADNRAIDERTDRERGSIAELVAPVALDPEHLRDVVEQGEGWEAIGDGAVRFRGDLEAAGVAVPPDASPVHMLSAEAICELGARTQGVAPEKGILPEYGRRPDAEIAQERKRAMALSQTTAAGHAPEGGTP